MTIIFYAIWFINNNIKTTNSHDNSIYYFENDRKIPDKKLEFKNSLLEGSSRILVVIIQIFLILFLFIIFYAFYVMSVPTFHPLI
jgi:hypothetical protein